VPRGGSDFLAGILNKIALKTDVTFSGAILNKSARETTPACFVANLLKIAPETAICFSEQICSKSLQNDPHISTKPLTPLP
jgi:hypothetical protein